MAIKLSVLEGDASSAQIISSAKKLSGYEAPKEIDEPLFAGRIQREGYVIEKYLEKGEGKYLIPYLLFKPDAPNGKGLIYLNPKGKVMDSDSGGQIEWFVKNGLTVLAPDIIGTGELGPGSFEGDSSYSGSPGRRSHRRPGGTVRFAQRIRFAGADGGTGRGSSSTDRQA